MSQDVYTRLREFLDRLPGGYPATESGVEVRILKKLFTAEQAEIAMTLTPLPEPASSVAGRLGLEEAAIAEKLESMAREGLVYRVRADGQALYSALQFVIGIYEFHLNTLDRELSELVEEYMPHLAEVWKSIPTKQLRVVPVGSALAADRTVVSYDQIRELVRTKTLAAVAPCICQKEQSLLGHGCTRPAERCLTFDLAAQYYIENGMGRPVSQEELASILRQGEEQGLVLSPTNAKDIMNICMCCGCCCGVLRMLKKLERPADYVQSSFRARIDPDRCTACGSCAEICQMEAIQETGEVHEVVDGRCIGCGLCVPVCPVEAVSLEDKGNIGPVPSDFIDMSIRIAQDRGVL